MRFPLVEFETSCPAETSIGTVTVPGRLILDRLFDFLIVVAMHFDHNEK